MSKWKKGSWLFRVYIYGILLPSYVGILINHEIRIPIKQPGFHGKYLRVFFSWLNSPQRSHLRCQPSLSVRVSSQSSEVTIPPSPCERGEVFFCFKWDLQGRRNELHRKSDLRYWNFYNLRRFCLVVWRVAGVFLNYYMVVQI